MTSMQSLIKQLTLLGIPCQTNVSMASYTTFRIGGHAGLLVAPQNEEQTVLCLRLIKEYKQPWIVLGRGSNVLFPDEDFGGVVVHLSALRAVDVRGETVYAMAGVPLSELSRAAQRQSLGGLSFAYGIPGTLGGALCMNAGAYGGEMSHVVRSVRVYDTQKDGILELDAKEMQFSYRHSLLLRSPHLVALGATLGLRREDGAAIEQQMQQYLLQRQQKQPLDYPSAGSVFKRPEGHFAGALIEQSGLKGYRIGGAMVSPKHAGFIVNVDNATAADVLALIEHVRRVVEQDHGVLLEPEIQIMTRLAAK